jgi:hypothetical protein
VNKNQPILEIIKKDSERKAMFENTCPSCQVDSEVGIVETAEQEECGGDALYTPVAQTVMS